MNTGRFILSQVLDLVHRQTLERLVNKYKAECKVRHFGCRQQLICMAFAQLTWREGLRDIADCLNARPSALYHLGFTGRTACSANAADNAVKEFYRLSLDRCKGLVRHARLNTQRKILAAMLSLWKSGEPFDPEKFFPRHESGQPREAVRPGSRR